MDELFGARYYDARTSVWQSADPAFEKYLPTGDSEQNSKLPGNGGITNSRNMAMYTYASQNPLVIIDPDGNWGISIKFQVSGGAVDNSGAISFGKGLLSTKDQLVSFTQETQSKGTTAGAGISVAFEVSFTGTETFNDIEGGSTSYGASLTPGPIGGGVEYSSPNNSDPSKEGSLTLSGILSIGTPAEGHVYQDNTKILSKDVLGRNITKFMEDANSLPGVESIMQGLSGIPIDIFSGN